MTFNLLWTDIENKILEKKNLKKEKKKGKVLSIHYLRSEV